jgi:P-type Ca2+ transporter type 2C
VLGVHARVDRDLRESRAIFANIRKFLRYLLSSNLGEVMTMFFGVLLAGPIGLEVGGGGVVLPLLATQLFLWLRESSKLIARSAPRLSGPDHPPKPLS